MNFYQNKLINGILCCCNPKLNLCNSHYVCGRDLALFGSLAQVENCLTGTTCKCKNLLNSKKALPPQK